jgi:hypothetical protein
MRRDVHRHRAELDLDQPATPAGANHRQACSGRRLDQRGPCVGFHQGCRDVEIGMGAGELGFGAVERLVSGFPDGAGEFRTMVVIGMADDRHHISADHPEAVVPAPSLVRRPTGGHHGRDGVVYTHHNERRHSCSPDPLNCLRRSTVAAATRRSCAGAGRQTRVQSPRWSRIAPRPRRPPWVYRPGTSERPCAACLSSSISRSAPGSAAVDFRIIAKTFAVLIAFVWLGEMPVAGELIGGLVVWPASSPSGWVAPSAVDSAGQVPYRPTVWVLPTAPNLSGFRIR